ncbi:MAG TPA: UrcA family protein [Rhizomicrobium sp.]|nr:UrcA family protein [Rhizomicrobium sp.]
MTGLKFNMEVTMTRHLYGLYGAFFIVGLGTAGIGPVLAAERSAEEEQVTVAAPYTIRLEKLNRAMAGQMPIERISVESSVSYADLDLSKQNDVDMMRHRIRHAAIENCRELDRRYPPAMYVPMDSVDCVKGAVNQANARLDEARATPRQSASR